MTVFVLKDEQTLVPLEPTQFVTEDEFQRLLANHPSLLSWDQADGSFRRWLLLKREKAIPAEEDGASRWSVDHLFADQNGVPTLVEVKRQTDTRLRREVVGQMLDYAANAVVYWPVDQLRAEFEAGCPDPAKQIREQLGTEIDPETMWQQVKTNLEAGRIRMLFVADRIPPELKRIVEFLNQQMNPAEVLALELRHFAGEGVRTIVPIVYGQTEDAKARKGTVASIKGTIAALRAHKTRWQRKLATATEAEKSVITAKMAEYEAAIASLLAEVEADQPHLREGSTIPEKRA